jgi:hypothetical protein
MSARCHPDDDLRRSRARSDVHRRLAARAVLALLICTSLNGPSAAAAGQPVQPTAEELWTEFPLDPRAERRTSTETASAPASGGGTGAQVVSESERSDRKGHVKFTFEGKSVATGHDSDGAPVPLPLLFVLAAAATGLLWVLALARRGTFRGSRLPAILARRETFRRSPLPAILPIERWTRAAATDGERVPGSIVRRVQGALGGDETSREDPAAAVSLAPAPAANAVEGDELLWLKDEVERARREHDVVSLLLVRAAGATGAAANDDVVDAVASSIEDAFHDVPRKVRRDDEIVSVLLPHTLAEGARHRAARLSLFLPDATPGTSMRTTLHTAVGCFPRDATTAEELLRMCKRALTGAPAGRDACE